MRIVLELDHLDDAVRCQAGDDEAVAEAVDRLVVEAVDVDHGHPEGRVQPRARDDGHLVARVVGHVRLAQQGGPLDLLPALLATIGRALLPARIEREVLDERPAERDVDDLDPAAHPEQRQAAVDRPPHEVELELVPVRVARAEQRMRLVAVAMRLDVVAAPDGYGVDHVEHWSTVSSTRLSINETPPASAIGRWKPTPR